MPAPVSTTASRTGGSGTSSLKEQRDAAWKADRDAAASQIALAFALAGLGEGKKLLCPSCGKVGKVKLHQDGKAHCHAEGEQFNAIDVLVKRGWTFGDAVDDLLGRPRRSTRHGAAPASPVPPPVKELPKIEEFTATSRPDIYAELLATGSLEAAQAFYGRFHIHPQAVAAAGAVRITDAKRSLATLRQKFSDDELIECGLAMRSANDDSVFLLVNSKWPIVEPHWHPDGKRVLTMQFRASEETEARIAAWKKNKAARKAAEDAGQEWTGPKLDYIPKFLSLVGAAEENRVGLGLPQIRAAALAHGPGLEVDVYEGGKDVLAGWTLRRVPYGLPGAKTLPPDRVMAEFLRLGVILRLVMDGDEAGEAGRRRVLDWCADWDVPARPHDLPAGQDVTDILVGRYAAAGDTCPACTEWKTKYSA